MSHLNKIFENADAVIILTEWDIYKKLNWQEVSKIMKPVEQFFEEIEKIFSLFICFLIIELPTNPVPPNTTKVISIFLKNNIKNLSRELIVLFSWNSYYVLKSEAFIKKEIAYF